MARVYRQVVVLSAPCSVSHLVEASVVDAEVVPDLVHDGLPISSTISAREPKQRSLVNL